MADLVDELRREIETLRERVRHLERQLVPTVEIPFEWGLPNSEARLFSHLLTRPLATKESCWHALYCDRIDEWPPIQVVESHICKLRSKIRRHGFDIRSERFAGYRMIRPEIIKSEEAA